MGTVFLHRFTGEVWERTQYQRSPPHGDWEEWIEIGYIDHRYRPHYWGAHIYKCKFCGEYYKGTASKFYSDEEFEGVCVKCNEMLVKYTDIKYYSFSEVISYNLDKIKEEFSKDENIDPVAKYALQAWRKFASMRRNIQIIAREWLWHLADVIDYIYEIRDIDDERKTALVRGELYEDSDGRLSLQPRRSKWTGHILNIRARATYLTGIDDVGNPFVHPVHPNCRTVTSSLAWATGLTKAQVKAMM